MRDRRLHIFEKRPFEILYRVGSIAYDVVCFGVGLGVVAYDSIKNKTIHRNKNKDLTQKLK